MDLTHIHTHGKYENALISNLDFIYDTLAASKDDDVFNNDAIKALIEIRWESFRQRLFLT